jgi:hypothetical protein
MFRFLQRFGRDSRARGRGTGPMTRVRRRDHRPDCEALEGRQLLSGYYIVNEASGKVLDDPGASLNNFAVIDQWQLNGAFNQRWDLVQQPGGDYEIRNEASDLVLDNSLSTIAGTNIDQFQPYGYSNQQWLFTLTQDGNGNYFCSGIVNAYSGMALDNSLSTSNGSPIVQMPQSPGATNQEWVFMPTRDVYQATYNIVNAASGDSLNDSPTPLGAATAWDFAPLADGYFLIVSEASGNVLQDPNFSTSPGTGVDLTQLNGGMNQQWYFEPAEFSYPTPTPIFSAIGRSSMVLDDINNPNGSPFSNGPQFIVDHSIFVDGAGDMAATQEWYLTPPPAGVDIHGQPSNAVVGQPIGPAITVAVVDAKGNMVTTNNTQLVTLSIASGPAGAQLLGTTTVRAINGVADFTNLTLSLAGTYTLTATGGALTPDFSNVFTVAPVNVTSAVTIHRGSMHKIGRAKASRNGAELVAQTITIKNASRQPLGGPLALRVGGLPTGVTLANATGTYEGGSYLDVLAADQPLAPGKSVTVTFDFSVSGRRHPSLSKLDDGLESLFGI